MKTYAAEDVKRLFPEIPGMKYVSDEMLSPFMRTVYEGFTDGRKKYRKRYAELVETGEATGDFPPLGIKISEKKVPALERFIKRNKAVLLERAADHIKERIEEKLKAYHKISRERLSNMDSDEER